MPFLIKQGMSNFSKVSTEGGYWLGPAGYETQIITSSGAFVGPGAGVSSLNGLTGVVTLSAGTGIVLTPVGNDIEIASDGSGGGITALTGDVTASGSGSVAATISNNVITNAMVNSSAAIAYSKLNLASSIVNADISNSAAIAYSKLNLSGSIVNADVNASAAIAYSKLNLSGSIVNADINASAAIAYSKLSLAGSIVNADINASAAIAFSKLASLTSAQILVGNGSNVATAVSMSGDITISNAGVTAIGANKVTNSQLAQMATKTFKGNNTGSTADPLDLTATQVTAELNNFVGDSGAGGTKGLVPAPASGDSTKVLKGNGSWTAMPARSVGITLDGAGSVITTGVKGYIEVPFTGTITGWTLLGDTTGSMVVDVWKDTYANYPPTVADTIAGSEKPTITSSNKGQDLTLTTWTPSVTAGDILAFNVDSCSTITRATLTIRITPS